MSVEAMINERDAGLKWALPRHWEWNASQNCEKNDDDDAGRNKPRRDIIHLRRRDQIITVARFSDRNR